MFEMLGRNQQESRWLKIAQLHMRSIGAHTLLRMHQRFEVRGSYLGQITLNLIVCCVLIITPVHDPRRLLVSGVQLIASFEMQSTKPVY